MKIRSSHYNEVFEEDGSLREVYAPLMETIENMGKERCSGLAEAARERLRELGATFPLSEDDGGRESVLPADRFPRIIPTDHWQIVSEGVLQRGKALNAWLTDLYNGEQPVVPCRIVESSVFYRNAPLPGPSMPNPIHVYGPDLVHLGSGKYVVLEDNVRVPSGITYSEALRWSSLDILKDLFSLYQVANDRAYYSKLRANLGFAAPSGVEEPCIAIVTRGEEDSAYYKRSLHRPAYLRASGGELRHARWSHPGRKPRHPGRQLFSRWEGKRYLGARRLGSLILPPGSPLPPSPSRPPWFSPARPAAPLGSFRSVSLR